jgi:hypothetical protein
VAGLLHGIALGLVLLGRGAGGAAQRPAAAGTGAGERGGLVAAEADGAARHHRRPDQQRRVRVDEVALRDVLGGDHVAALLRVLGRFHRTALKAVAGPMLLLVLPAAVEDGLAAGALLRGRHQADGAFALVPFATTLFAVLVAGHASIAPNILRCGSLLPFCQQRNEHHQPHRPGLFWEWTVASAE